MPPPKVPYRYLVPDFTQDDANPCGTTVGQTMSGPMRTSASDHPPPQPLTEQERLLPLANIGHIMASVLPKNAKISKEAKQLTQELTTELICFATSECNDVSLAHGRKSIGFDDLVEGFENVDLGMFIPLMKRRAALFKQNPEDSPPPNQCCPLTQTDSAPGAMLRMNRAAARRAAGRC
jgi:histone H3/H4